MASCFPKVVYEDRCTYFGARYYDPNISIWLSVDPLSDEASGWTPYRYAFNNPIRIIDPNGMLEDDYIVNKEGTLTEVVKTESPDRILMENEDGSKVELEFNDPSNDRYQLPSYKVGEQLVDRFTDSDINSFMESSGMEKKNLLGRYYTAATESKGQMDFGVLYLKANPTKDGEGGFVMFGSQQKVYNRLDGGNFLWGQGMNRLGFNLSTAKFGANANEWFKDTPEDQRAISDGFQFRVN